jgi:two-component system, NarL family, nitrate/nitrite response regulator NarL
VVPVRALRKRSRGSPRVAVASDQRLVAESVAAALREQSFDIVVVQWPDADFIGHTDRRGPRPTRRRPTPAPDVGLVLTDLLRMEQVRAARVLVGSLDVPWLVLTLAPRGPAWGAMYDRGATLVLPSGGLEATTELIADLATGWRPDLSRRERKQLVHSWRTFESERAEMAARLQTLSDREEEVLQRLHEGVGVRAIAEQAEVAEATVRSQVKAILRKLHVSSQMAAVLAYEEQVTDSMDPDLHHVG